MKLSKIVGELACWCAGGDSDPQMLKVGIDTFPWCNDCWHAARLQHAVDTFGPAAALWVETFLS